ncbi:hypothetical protein ACFSZS_08905 [Seohaeicola zhoushanensis]
MSASSAARFSIASTSGATIAASVPVKGRSAGAPPVTCPMVCCWMIAERLSRSTESAPTLPSGPSSRISIRPAPRCSPSCSWPQRAWVAPITASGRSNRSRAARASARRSARMAERAPGGWASCPAAILRCMTDAP